MLGDKVTLNNSSEEIPKEDEDLKGEEKLVEKEGNIFVPCGLMMKALNEDVWPEEGEVLNFNLMMSKDPNSNDEEFWVQKKDLGVKTSHLLFTTLGTSIVPTSK